MTLPGTRRGGLAYADANILIISFIAIVFNNIVCGVPYCIR